MTIELHTGNSWHDQLRNFHELGHVTVPVTSARVQIDIARQMFDATLSMGPLFDPDGHRMKG